MIVGEYPAAAALRRRRQEQQQPQMPPEGMDAIAEDVFGGAARRFGRARGGEGAFRADAGRSVRFGALRPSHIYCLASAFVAFLAIVMSSGSTHTVVPANSKDRTTGGGIFADGGGIKQQDENDLLVENTDKAIATAIIPDGDDGTNLSVRGENSGQESRSISDSSSNDGADISSPSGDDKKISGDVASTVHRDADVWKSFLDFQSYFFPRSELNSATEINLVAVSLSNSSDKNSSVNSDGPNASGGFFAGLFNRNSNANALNRRDRKMEVQKEDEQTKTEPQHTLPGWLRWLAPPNNKVVSPERDSSMISLNQDKNQKNPSRRNPLLSFLRRLIDPSILSPSEGSATDVIDKILSSTPRLLAIANLLLAVTYLLHSAVAEMFLGGVVNTIGTATSGNSNGMLGEVDRREENFGGFGGMNDANNTNRIHRAGRERLGGYLLFKLLLISAVVEPDTLDLLILLSWYTLLSFLRSLAHLAGATTAHTSQSGQPPQRGVLRLLLVVLMCNFMAAAACAALFHGAGWGMVLLLTCDCALLAVDVLCHVARHIGQVLEERHSSAVADMEETQLRLHASLRGRVNEVFSVRRGAIQQPAPIHEGVELEVDAVRDNRDESSSAPFTIPATPSEVEAESRLIDRQMEVLEAAHAHRLTFLDNTVFALELLALTLTVAHFLHIWSMHGVTFGLVDGVLALHLHSALTAMGKKVAERRNLNRIARDLDGFFEDATELEMRKASVAGDVCCICLGTMSVGNVKKVGCGHLYHTHCLREVVERARSIEAARCPLCRASVVDGRQMHGVAPSTSPNNNENAGVPPGAPTNNNVLGASPEAQTAEENTTEGGTVAIANAGVGPQQQQPPPGGNNEGQRQVLVPPPLQAQMPRGLTGGGEHALFRFSTEGILPPWLPLPAFSFEVVRRPPMAPDGAGVTDNRALPQNQRREIATAGARSNGNNNTGGDANAVANNNNNQQPSFWRRMLVVAGLIPMSAEEEAIAVSQLVDMFPQYERSDLLRELRQRGSSEAVVEVILAGVFVGVQRNGAIRGSNDNPIPGQQPAVAPNTGRTVTPHVADDQEVEVALIAEREQALTETQDDQVLSPRDSQNVGMEQQEESLTNGTETDSNDEGHREADTQ